VYTLDGEIYLVEMKWLSSPVGVDEIAPHFVRVFFRNAARGIFISASGFSDPAVKQSTDALGKMVSVLCELEELVRLLEHPNGNVRGAAPAAPARDRVDEASYSHPFLRPWSIRATTGSRARRGGRRACIDGRRRAA